MLGIVTGLELEKQLCLKAYKAIAKDSPLIICAAGTIEGAERAAKDLIDQGASHLISFGPVSYTHLTLPTIYSV